MATTETRLDVTPVTVIANLSVSPVSKPIPMNAEQVRIVYDSPYPDYKGPTDVTPQVIGQELQTQNTLLRNNITIAAIPYYETSNPSGGYTAIIGG